ncbi:MAG: YigZ family protein [Candidatus Peribacteria bacterium]|nr:YigZ family protein [Candidatus Peribacteria bacterium]
MNKLFYTTVTEIFTYELPKIKKSTFFGTLFPVEEKRQADDAIAMMRKKYYNATHHCYAYCIGLHVHTDLFGNVLIDAQHTKAYDDGEPTNTAGKPILSVLKGYPLHNVLLVATRYFGGTLLGVGGLIQAYTKTAQETLHHAPLVQKEIYNTLELYSTYQQTSLVAYLLEKYEVQVLAETYDTQIYQKLQINRGLSEAFIQEIRNKNLHTLKVTVLH